MSKPLTNQEMLYRALVSELIQCREVSAKEKKFRLMNFWNQSDFYYDIFCESIYMLMTDKSVDTLSIDDSGYTRSDIIILKDDFYPGFELLSKDDIQPEVDDVIVYIDLALTRLNARIKNHHTNYSLSEGKSVFQTVK